MEPKNVRGRHGTSREGCAVQGRLCCGGRAVLCREGSVFGAVTRTHVLQIKLTAQIHEKEHVLARGNKTCKKKGMPLLVIVKQ